jgi:hypothetical protein
MRSRIKVEDVVEMSGHLTNQDDAYCCVHCQEHAVMRTLAGRPLCRYCAVRELEAQLPPVEHPLLLELYDGLPAAGGESLSKEMGVVPQSAGLFQACVKGGKIQFENVRNIVVCEASDRKAHVKFIACVYDDAEQLPVHGYAHDVLIDIGSRIEIRPGALTFAFDAEV